MRNATFIDDWITEGIEKGRMQGHVEGLQEGKKKGLRQGLEQGALQMARENIRELLLVRFGKIPRQVSLQLKQIDNKKQLKDLLRLAAIAPSLETFLAEFLTSVNAPETYAIAHKLWGMGLDASKIAEATGLSPEIVTSLRPDNISST